MHVVYLYIICAFVVCIFCVFENYYYYLSSKVLLLQVRIKIKVLLFILPPLAFILYLYLISDSLLREQPWLRALLAGMVHSLYPYASSPS